ncbi:MAG: class I SAM-dependent rRNA methyltransferase [Kiloniellales bacterium]
MGASEITEPSLDDPASRPRVVLLPGRHKRVKAGHPWAYSNEIVMDQATKRLPPGGTVELMSDAGESLGVAFFNPHSLVALRLLAPDSRTVIDQAFLTARLRRALELRQRLFDQPYYRLVHAEGDGLPGLVIDRYGDVLVCQLNAAGIDRLRGPLLAAVERLLEPATVVLRNDGALRALEGLEAEVEVRGAALDGPVRLKENGVEFHVDLAGGQKTGWFFDQRRNRAFVAALAKDARVLDLYCFTGGFGVQAAVAGAREATLVDRSAAALALAERAARANRVAERCRFVKADAFAEMERRADRGQRFEVVIADPPAFVKSRKDLQAGLKGYRKLTRLAARLVEPGGFLFLASCSHNVAADAFQQQVSRGLSAARRRGRIIRVAGAGPDHPIHPQLPESAYLKSLVVQLD